MSPSCIKLHTGNGIPSGSFKKTQKIVVEGLDTNERSEKGENGESERTQRQKDSRRGKAETYRMTNRNRYNRNTQTQTLANKI